MRAVLYARQSKDRQAGIKTQLDDGAALCKSRGWTMVARESDNDISASNGKTRPGYERVLDLIRRDGVDCLVVTHIDRLLRRLADLEDLIDLTTAHGVRVCAISGDIDLSHDAGRMVGRMLAVVARGEIERKSARQRRAALQAAEDGLPRRGTPPPFGWLPDRMTAHPVEGPAVAEACRVVLAGGTLSGVVRTWTKAGLRPHQSRSGRWTHQSVRSILANPRNAAIATYKGRECGTGQWEPLVSEATYRALIRFLNDPSRQRTRGVRTMLGGLAVCGKCGNHVTGGPNHRQMLIYRCNPATRGGAAGPHCAVQAVPTDAYVADAVIARLSRPDAVDLLTPAGNGERIRELRDEAMAIRERLASLGAMFARGDLDEADLISGRRWGQSRLDEIEAELAELGRESVLAPLVAAENVAAAWGALGVDRRRAVVDALMTVRLNPVGQGVRKMDIERVIELAPK